MKFFILLSVTLGCALANSAHYIADSRDVAAAKLAHFEEKAKAAAAVGAAPDYVTSYYLNYYKNYNGGQQKNSYNAPALITVLPSGYLADTPEVAAAKASHFAEQAKATYASGASSSYIIPQTINSDYYDTYTSKNYNDAPASITVLPSGYLADTPEVAAAKASLFAEQARAAQAAAANPDYGNYYYRT